MSNSENWHHQYSLEDITGTYQSNGQEKSWFDENYALGLLLLDGVLFCNQREYVEYDGVRYGASTTILFVLCNDIFMWGCADGEPILNSEIEALFKLWHHDKQWGSAKWCCIKRNEQPQKPVADAMKKAGVWDKQMEGLRPNSYQAFLAERAAEKKDA